MRRMKALCLLAVLSALLQLSLPLAALGQSADAADPYETVRVIARTKLWKEINSGKAGSATVAVMDGGKIVYSEGFGMADREKAVPVDQNTIFNIGSISKTFVAGAIMLLVQWGNVALDDPVTKYLPEFTMSDSRYRDISVRMLLNHTSGIPGSSFANNTGFRYNDAVFQNTLDNLSRSHLRHAPGEMAAYTNDGFTLAEMIVERVSGKKFVDFLRANVFEPLGMHNTGRGVGDLPPRAVAAYYEPESGKRFPLEVLSPLAAGGLGSTADDLVRFGDTFARGGNRILAESIIAEMTKAQPPDFSPKLRNQGWTYGLGLDVTDLPQYKEKGIKVIGKGGNSDNYSSMLFVAPDQRLAVAVIEAGAGANANVIALDLLDALLVRKGLVPGKAETVARPLVPRPIPPELSAFEGYYQGDSSPRKAVLDRQANTLALSSPKDGGGEPLVFLYDGNYFNNPLLGLRAYFLEGNGKQYFVLADVLGIGDIVYMQRLDRIDIPKSLGIDVKGKTWLRRNVASFVSMADTATHVVNSDTIDDLPGYVNFGPALVVKAPDFAGMMGGMIRDQSELTLTERDGTIWVLLSDMVYMPAELAGSFTAGENRVTISSAGYSEWLGVTEDVALTFAKLAGGRVIVFSPDGTRIYDSAVDSGGVYVEQGGFVEFAGEPGDVFAATAAGFEQHSLASNAADSWEAQFEASHGRKPTAQDENDLRWSRDFTAQNGRSPTDEEWERRWREAQQ